MEPRQLLTTMLGLTTADTLVNFDSARPDVIRSSTSIGGLQPGESILAIDSRTTTGQVFGLGSSGRVYRIDPFTGTTAQVGDGPIATSLSGGDFDIDFRSSSSTLRIVSDGGMDVRFDVDTATLTDDGNLAYASNDPGAGTTPQIVAAAYNNNDGISGASTLFEVDAKRNMLVTQGAQNSSDHTLENMGQLFSFQPLGLSLVGPVGLESTPGGQLFLSATTSGGAQSALYTVAREAPATLVGEFPTSVTIRDITSLPDSPLVYALTANNTIVSFRASTPGDLLSVHPITGLQLGETIASITFDHSDGTLYGFGTTGRLYTINPQTAAAAPRSSSPIAPAYDGSKPSITFLSGADTIRLVTKQGQDLQINPLNGTVVAVDNPLAYVPMDPGTGFPPSIVAEGEFVQPALSNGYPTTAFDLIGIDSARDTLVEQTGAPASGAIATAASLGLNTTDDTGLDATLPADPNAAVTLVSLTAPGASASTLYRVFASFAGTNASLSLVKLGDIAGGAIIRDIAIAPTGYVFIDPPGEVAETAGAATVTVRRLGGASGPLAVRAVSSDGTAKAGIDYTPVNALLNFADGETSKTFTVPIIAGSFLDGMKTLNLSLYPDTYPAGSVISATTLTIVGTAAVGPAKLQSVSFEGTASAIQSVLVTFTAPVDFFTANSVAEYRVVGVTADRSHRTVVIPLLQLGIDPPGPGTLLTTQARIDFASPIALKNFRSLQVTARGIGPNAFDSTVTYTITRGAIVHYTDGDGDRVVLGVIGRGAKLIVLRRADGQAVSVFVEGKGKSVFGFLIPTRKSNHKTTIDRFVTGGAKLNLPKSIAVTQAVAS
jgi:Domain of unknown function (DUF4394)/Calx-beta domain